MECNGYAANTMPLLRVNVANTPHIVHNNHQGSNCLTLIHSYNNVKDENILDRIVTNIISNQLSAKGCILMRGLNILYTIATLSADGAGVGGDDGASLHLENLFIDQCRIGALFPNLSNCTMLNCEITNSKSCGVLLLSGKLTITGKTTAKDTTSTCTECDAGSYILPTAVLPSEHDETIDCISCPLGTKWKSTTTVCDICGAGKLLHANPDLDEECVLMRALRDFNTPKIPAHDMPIFMRLIKDLFPTYADTTPPVVDEDLKKKIIITSMHLLNVLL